ncbi:unnamed protein product [Adineta ricciae]|uniref:Uncharacterized protein n=1 Tax=Adineta ricciae TaxID=249248 RepID=A0A815IXP0_ADIRI|nr:unnamed protein product [Adineta ricciae]CAF1668046.1 unnamed protein product [Adineta ricciae]
MSACHFFNKQFYYHKLDTDALPSIRESDTLDSYTHIRRARVAPAELMLQHISSNKLDFDYLSDDDLSLLLTAVLSWMRSSYTAHGIHKSLNKFTELIIGQSVFALRYCLKSCINSVSLHPCIVISTLFLQIPVVSTTKLYVFQLIPLPFIFNHEMYAYSSLPKTIGINAIDNTLLL